MNTTMSDSIVIVGAARTPMGGMLGDLSNVPAAELGSTAIRAAIERAGLAADSVSEVIMGNCLMAGQGQAPARQAALGAGLPTSAGATTISKMCGSGLKAVMLAHDLIRAGSSEVMVAGGMENMSAAPYLLPKGRQGMRLGHGQVMDHMFLDGLEDAYDRGKLMGCFADATASAHDFTREQQDAFAIESLRRAQEATEQGQFSDEIAPVTLRSRKGETQVTVDEQPGKARPDKIPQLKPAFGKDGTVTAANASSISDGAAALVVMRETDARNQGLKPLARIVGHASHAQEPQWFTTAPVGATRKLLERVGWTAAEVDLWEINEAFAVVTLAAMKELELDHSKVNVHGGACALGHPIGASGARILVSLLYAMQQRDLQKGIATLCIGGGEAVAMAVERLDS
nr:acetyl-CoA C-acyltransferase [Oceanococcus sp. HetDA_MAG_MS8]